MENDHTGKGFVCQQPISMPHKVSGGGDAMNCLHFSEFMLMGSLIFQVWYLHCPDVLIEYITKFQIKTPSLQRI
ncbi:MAG: hypothetical protein C4522_11265 [Desulfobacteraceae bacterium]|nr:MAG: hypothetical protein C4522_11265 [Desulfobacteraceae bacterium]